MGTSQYEKLVAIQLSALSGAVLISRPRLFTCTFQVVGSVRPAKLISESGLRVISLPSSACGVPSEAIQVPEQKSRAVSLLSRKSMLRHGDERGVMGIQ